MPLKVSDGVGSWIKDFKKSDAPQFTGKSAEERRKMAVAAYMSAKNESTDEYGKSMDKIANKKKNDAMTLSDKDKLGKLADLMAKEKQMKKESIEYVMEHGITGKRFTVSEKNVEKLQAVGYSIIENKDDVPFDPDPPKASSKNSDGTPTSPMSRAKQLAKLAARLRNKKKEEGYVSHAQRKAVWASRNDKKNEAVEENNNAPQTAAHRRAMMVGVNRSNKVKLKGFGPDQAKGNMGNPSARAALKVKESVELEEAHAYAKAAKALHDYGTKHGGMDKADFHTAAKHLDNVGKAGLMQKGQHLAKMNDHFRSLDTDVRDRIHITLKKHGVMESVQVDELKKSTLGSYVKKASQDAGAKAYSAAQKAMSNPDQSGKDYVKSVKRQKGIARATDKLTKEENLDELKKSTLGNYVKVAAKDAASKAYGAASAAKDNRANQAGKDFSKSMKRLRGIDTATKKLAKEGVEEAKSFDQKFKDHLKFATSKSPAVQAYMKKRRDDREARHAKQDPAAVKKNYGPAVIPPGTAYNKASKRGMNPSQAADAVSTAFKNRAKGGKLPK